VFCDLLAGISPTTGPILRAGAVELLVPLATLTGQSDTPGVLAGYGPVIADIARQIATTHARHIATPADAAKFPAAGAADGGSGSAATAEDGSGLAATARAAAAVVAPQPPVQWRYRVFESGNALLFGIDLLCLVWC
jgi:hypothetical protein